MNIRVARSTTEIDGLEPLWRELYAGAPDATLFQSFEWNRLAAECFAGRESPCVVAAESAGGAALLPAAVTRTGLVFLGEALFDYRDVLAIGDEDALRAAWAKLADLRLPLSVTAVRERSIRERWADFQPAAAPFVKAPQVKQTEVYADEFARRHTRLGRALRRMARAGVSLRRHCGSNTQLVRHIYQQKAAQPLTTGENLFRDPRRVDFVVAVAAMLPEACDIFTLEAAGHLVAALVSFQDRGVRRLYTVYFDVTWAEYSPGTALCYELTRRSLEQGFDCDFMTGEQPHKLRLATSAQQLYRVEAPASQIAIAGTEEQLAA